MIRKSGVGGGGPQPSQVCEGVGAEVPLNFGVRGFGFLPSLRIHDPQHASGLVTCAGDDYRSSTYASASCSRSSDWTALGAYIVSAQKNPERVRCVGSPGDRDSDRVTLFLSLRITSATQTCLSPPPSGLRQFLDGLLALQVAVSAL